MLELKNQKLWVMLERNILICARNTDGRTQNGEINGTGGIKGSKYETDFEKLKKKKEKRSIV